MRYGELINLLIVDLQGLLRSHVRIKDATFQQVIAISIIPDTGIEMTSLSRKLGIDNSTATRLVDGLGKKHWIEKTLCPDDKRVVIVLLTRKGVMIQKKIESQFDKIGEKVESLFAATDSINILEGMRSLHWKLARMLLNKK